MKTIAILNQKGGVGKTTVTVNLGCELARRGRRTLLVDLDPQGHSSCIYVLKAEPGRTTATLFLDPGFEIGKALYPAETVSHGRLENLHVLPAEIDLAVAAEAIVRRTQRERILQKQLAPLAEDFDYCLLDCPPSLGALTGNAVWAADTILIPTSYSRFSLDGIADLFLAAAEVKESRDFGYLILRNLHDARTRRTNQAVERQLARFSGNLLHTVIRRSEAVNQAQMLSLPVGLYAPGSAGAKDFAALVEEIISYYEH